MTQQLNKKLRTLIVAIIICFLFILIGFESSPSDKGGDELGLALLYITCSIVLIICMALSLSSAYSKNSSHVAFQIMCFLIPFCSVSLLIASHNIIFLIVKYSILVLLLLKTRKEHPSIFPIILGLFFILNLRENYYISIASSLIFSLGVFHLLNNTQRVSKKENILSILLGTLSFLLLLPFLYIIFATSSLTDEAPQGVESIQFSLKIMGALFILSPLLLVRSSSKGRAIAFKIITTQLVIYAVIFTAYGVNEHTYSLAKFIFPLYPQNLLYSSLMSFGLDIPDRFTSSLSSYNLGLSSYYFIYMFNNLLLLLLFLINAMNRQNPVSTQAIATSKTLTAVENKIRS